LWNVARTDTLSSITGRSPAEASFGLRSPKSSAALAVELRHEAILYEADAIVDRAYFPENALISLVIPLEDGGAVESAMVGGDGLVGGWSAIDGQYSPSRAIVQIPGTALSMDAAALRRLTRESSALRSLIAAHEGVVLRQSQQSAACNATHSLHERFAKWLLLARARVASDTLILTQEFIAEMLGVRRTSVTVEAHSFQEAGFIRYRRGRVHILKPDELKEAACECYGVITKRFERMLQGGKNTALLESVW
jgi:CRP-like cAMP-binding protein